MERDAFAVVADVVDLSTAVIPASLRNDLLPSRPDDRMGGGIADRFVKAIGRRMDSGQYVPDRAVSVMVPKVGFTTRVASLLTLTDRVVYVALVEPLRTRIEKGLVSSEVLMWPRGVETAPAFISFEKRPLTLPGAIVVKADVTGFYESVDHAVLRDQLVQLTGKTELVTALIEFLGLVMGGPRGLPQGLATSDVLATAYLASVDSDMLQAGYDYWRHGDDIRMVVADRDVARRALHELSMSMRAIRLLLNGEKSFAMPRASYEGQLTAVSHARSEIEERLVAEEEESLIAGESARSLDDILDEADIDEQDRWDAFYHGDVDRQQEIMDIIRPLLKPADLDVALAQFEEAVNRAPGSGHGEELGREIFHGLLTSALTTLNAGRSPDAVKRVAMLISDFPEQTEALATYLMAVTGTSSADVQVEATSALLGYRLGWQQAWLLHVLERVAQVSPLEDWVIATVEIIASDEDTEWLPRVHAARVLATAGQLPKDLHRRLWVRVPAPLRVDLVVAAVAMSGHATWAEAFVDSLHADPLYDVVLKASINSGSEGK